MNVLATQYTLCNKALEIYIAGCNGDPHCEDCHNPESWDFSLGSALTLGYFSKNIGAKINEFSTLIENIMIFGGEPLDQPPSDLEELLSLLSFSNKKIWIFTRYPIEEVPDFVKHYCDYIKCGKYEKNLTSDNNIQYGIKLASNNQKIYKKGIDY